LNLNSQVRSWGSDGSGHKLNFVFGLVSGGTCTDTDQHHTTNPDEDRKEHDPTTVTVVAFVRLIVARYLPFGTLAGLVRESRRTIPNFQAIDVYANFVCSFSVVDPEQGSRTTNSQGHESETTEKTATGQHGETREL
jgi:hypothetical protein